MSTDRSEKQRAALTDQIAAVEGQEDELSELQASYQRSLEQFSEQFHAVTHRRKTSLHQQASAGSTTAQREFVAQDELLARVDRHVDEAFEALEEVGSRVRSALDAKREQLIQERNALPWA